MPSFRGFAIDFVCRLSCTVVDLRSVSCVFSQHLLSSLICAQFYVLVSHLMLLVCDIFSCAVARVVTGDVAAGAGGSSGASGKLPLPAGGGPVDPSDQAGKYGNVAAAAAVALVVAGRGAVVTGGVVVVAVAVAVAVTVAMALTMVVAATLLVLVAVAVGGFAVAVQWLWLLQGLWLVR